MTVSLLLLLLFLQEKTFPEPILSNPVQVSASDGKDEDPALVRAVDGRFYVVWSSQRRGGTNLYIKSSDDGVKWTTEERVTAGGGENYYPALIQGRDGTFHLAWFRLDRKARDMDIWYSRSRDGRDWSDPIEIGSSTEPDWAPAIHEGADGIVRIIWSSSQTGNRELFMSTSDNRGLRWSPERQVTESPEEDDFPCLIQTANKEFILAWTRYRKGSKLLSYTKDASAELVIARSSDAMRWSRPSVVSQPDEKTRFLDLLPFMFADNSGQHIYLSWTSSRTDSRGDILAGELNDSPLLWKRLTTYKGIDYDARIVATKNPDEFLMVWVSGQSKGIRLFSRIVRFR